MQTTTTQVPVRRIRLLGGEVDLVTPKDVLDFVEARLAEGRRGLVANHNFHSLHLVQRDEVMAGLYRRADLIEIDSTPMIAWGRLLGLPVSRRHRCTYLDWRADFWSRAQVRGWRVFYLGGAPGVAEAAKAKLAKAHPGAVIAVRDGYFDLDRDAAEVRSQIEAFRPDVLFVGMGMPRQERWIAANLDHLPPCVIFPIGAAFDYEAGASPTPPRWTGRIGLEWLARFLAEPRRLFSRYFVEPWSLIGPALRDLQAVRRA